MAGDLPSLTPEPRAGSIAISSRSASERYRPEVGASLIGHIPPTSRDHLVRRATDTPAAIAASAVVDPLAIWSQNLYYYSRRLVVRAPGDWPLPRITHMALRASCFVAIAHLRRGAASTG